MLTPRPYISYSQMVLLEQDPEKYVAKYFHNRSVQRTTINMKYGSKMADALENDELSGDPMLDFMMIKIPKFELRDQIVTCENGVDVPWDADKKTYRVPFLEDKSDKIPLLAKPDTAKADYSAFKEYKTSTHPWTQGKVDRSAQITFYATAIWLIDRKIPEDIELVDVLVEYSNGKIQPVGGMKIFQTKRTIGDILKMTKRIRESWQKIKQLGEAELL